MIVVYLSDLGGPSQHDAITIEQQCLRKCKLRKKQVGCRAVLGSGEKNVGRELGSHNDDI